MQAKIKLKTFLQEVQLLSEEKKFILYALLGTLLGS
jgi:hypothetical protein